MALPSGESLLISALLNNENVAEAVGYGITAEHFIGYKDHYNWMRNYVDTYGCDPTADIFLAEFPSYPISSHHDVRSAADKVSCH